MVPFARKRCQQTESRKQASRPTTGPSITAISATALSRQNQAHGTAALSGHSNGGTDKGTKTLEQNALPNVMASYAANATNSSTNRAPTHRHHPFCHDCPPNEGQRASLTITQHEAR